MKKNILSNFQNKPLPSDIEECHELIRELLSSSLKEIEKLTIENTALKERLLLNSSNSSLPPSQDRSKKKKKNMNKPSGRSKGGQPGHPGHCRKLVEGDQIDEVIQCTLPEHCMCGGVLAPSNSYQRHQVYELPEVKMRVTEYQLEKRRCLTCQHIQIASLPEGVSWGITGPRLTGFITYMVSRYHLSRRDLQCFFKEHYQFEISLGSVCNKQRLMTEVLVEPIKALAGEVKKSPWMNIDETGHRRDGKKQWLWCMVSATAAFFSVEASRGKKVLKALAGDYPHVVISDRYAAYNLFESDQRQVCWAHLKRDFTRLSEKKEPSIARIGKALLEQLTELFGVWHQFKIGEITAYSLTLQCMPIRKKVGEYLEQGSYTDPTLRAARFCKNLLACFNALWTFITEEGVEPTNNHAERCLRPAVLWRKTYFGSRSDYGSKFVAQISSILMTCKLQLKNPLNYLSKIIHCYFSKQPLPLLINPSG